MVKHRVGAAAAKRRVKSYVDALNAYASQFGGQQVSQS